MVKNASLSWKTLICVSLLFVSISSRKESQSSVVNVVQPQNNSSIEIVLDLPDTKDKTAATVTPSVIAHGCKSLMYLMVFAIINSAGLFAIVMILQYRDTCCPKKVVADVEKAPTIIHLAGAPPPVVPSPSMGGIQPGQPPFNQPSRVASGIPGTVRMGPP